jgi:hypothetical protein
LLVKFDGLLGAFGFVGHDVAEEGTCVGDGVPFIFLLAYFIIWSAFNEYVLSLSIQNL